MGTTKLALKFSGLLCWVEVSEMRAGAALFAGAGVRRDAVRAATLDGSPPCAW